MELEPNSLDWNGNELEHELELEDMKRTNMSFVECKGIVQYELMIIICDLKIQKSSTICHTSSQANKILVLRHIVQFQKK